MYLTPHPLPLLSPPRPASPLHSPTPPPSLRVVLLRPPVAVTVRSALSAFIESGFEGVHPAQLEGSSPGAPELMSSLSPPLFTPAGAQRMSVPSSSTWWPPPPLPAPSIPENTTVEGSRIPEENQNQNRHIVCNLE